MALLSFGELLGHVGLARPEEFETGYLAGLVDGEGYIYVAYDKPSNRTYRALRVHCISKPIVDGASRMMMKSFPRRVHGEMAGWIAASSGRKALNAMLRIQPYLTDSSKKCRALTCLRIFKNEVGITGRHPSSEVFAACPPPGKLSGKTQLESDLPTCYRERKKIPKADSGRDFYA